MNKAFAWEKVLTLLFIAHLLSGLFVDLRNTDIFLSALVIAIVVLTVNIVGKRALLIKVFHEPYPAGWFKC